MISKMILFPLLHYNLNLKWVLFQYQLLLRAPSKIILLHLNPVLLQLRYQLSRRMLLYLSRKKLVISEYGTIFNNIILYLKFIFKYKFAFCYVCTYFSPRNFSNFFITNLLN